MTYKSTVLADNPMMYYAFDNGSLADLGSANRPLSLVSGEFMSPVMPTLIDTPLDKGYNFATVPNGNQGELTGSNFPSVAIVVGGGVRPHFSIEFWIKTGTSVSSHNYVLSPSSSANTGLVLMSGTSIQMQFDTSGHYVTSAAGVGNSAWHHVVFTWDGNGSSGAVYVDGVLSGTNSGSAANVTAGGNFYIGGQGADTSVFRGALDEVAFYSYPLSSDRVLAHYQAATTTYFRGWGIPA